MTQDVQARLSQTFGSEALGPALFYRMPFALRIALGPEEDMSGEARFEQAFARARAVVSSVFSGSHTVWAALGNAAHWRFARLENLGESDSMLTAAIGAELDIPSKAPPCAVYLFDLERGLLLHPYDDRGLDLAAVTLEALRPFYAEFNGWLLDFDRPRMDRMILEG
jgi:hypothetical protein